MATSKQKSNVKLDDDLNYWLNHIQKQRASDLTIPEYCKKNKISPFIFHEKKKVLVRKGVVEYVNPPKRGAGRRPGRPFGSKNKKHDERSSFSILPTVETTIIETRHGDKVHIPGKCSAPFIAELVRLLSR